MLLLGISTNWRDATVSDIAGAAFTAILAVPITQKGLPPAFEGAQADADLIAGAHQADASGIRLADQLDHLPPVCGAGQPSASSEQKAWRGPQNLTHPL